MARKKKAEARDGNIRFTRRRGGSLENLPHMPLDIVVEIMTYLRPLDILHLARTTKEFRAFLMKPSSEFIWKKARKNVEDFPQRPDDLSEPAYANLAFDTHCHLCSAPGVKLVHWELRTKYCPACRKAMFLCRAALIREFPILHALGAYEFETLFPSIPYGARGCQFHLPHVQAYVEALPEENVYVAFDLNTILSQNWTEQPDMKIKIEHAVLCEEWQEKMKGARQNELQAIRDRRRAEIFKRLEDLGWGPDLVFMAEYDWDDLDSHPRLTEPKDLTDRMWDNIKPAFETILSTARTTRLMLERKIMMARRLTLFNTVYAEWRRDQDPSVMLPQAVDFALKKEIQDIVTAPPEAVFTKQSFDAIKDAILDWVDEWRNTCQSALRAKFSWPKEMTHIPDRFDLDLATTVWVCTTCSLASWVVIHYPDILEHRCMYTIADSIGDEFDSPAEEAKVVSAIANHYRTWECLSIRSGKAPIWAAQVVEACGMDPLTTTREEMDALDVRLTCKKCPIEPRSAHLMDTTTVFNWRAAVRHHAMHERSFMLGGPWAYLTGAKPSPVWERVDSKHISVIKTTEAQARPYYNPLSDNDYSPVYMTRSGPFHCSYCPAAGMNANGVAQHFLEGHEDLVEDDGPKFYIDRQLQQVVSSPIMLISGTNEELQAKVAAIDSEDEISVKWLEQGRAAFVRPEPVTEEPVSAPQS